MDIDGLVDENYIRTLVVERRWTHKEISNFLKENYPGKDGLSEMSVRRYCKVNNIHKSSRLPDNQLDVVVSNAVSQVGPTYGRKMLKGKLEAEGVRVHDKRISKSLQRVAPGYHQQRVQNTARLFNPLPYKSDYFGHKIHLDQNEKLVMYGCTTVIASDGYSNYVLAAASMPVKNNVEIYRAVLRPILLEYGLWDQVRVDCGKEFYLTLFVQETLAPHRCNTLRKPFKQTPSTKNHMAERHWVEVNGRVNYPIKQQLHKMVQEELIDMTDEIDKYCVSWITIQTVQAGIQELLPAWNNHSIPGKGKPVNIMRTCYSAVSLQEHSIPTPEAAVLQYERAGGKLKHFGLFGVDPLESDPFLRATRSREFLKHFPSFDVIFNELVNNKPNMMRQAVMLFINITRDLAVSSS
ncbi:uncharacterized protein LOC110238104 [Exaiptasia diaphana]|uniref:Integrase core domain-containing protein n=1 Tax=Exaiptasia diaphana TaxID=2652724 RepID=A0A913X5T8_EXADI|nr:uncharacterized protein LOC110238104 [Exaiptasia diaphana]